MHEGDATIAKPRISIVIPVYNKEDSVERCVSSIVGEGKSDGDREIVLIDDGSRDDSLRICAELAGKYENVYLYAQDNCGVSAARNNGVKHARGTYVLFLDADDFLTAGSIDAIADTFDKFADQVDLLTYPILYISENDGTTHGHKRSKWLTETGVYALDDYPWICQTTMNVCVKRQCALEHPFSTELSMGEDQLFNTMILAGKANIGYCAEAMYEYVRSNASVSSRMKKPVYIFDQMIELYEALLKIGRENERMGAYCREMVMYNFSWRCSDGALFPDFGDEGEREANYERLLNVAREMPVSAYLSSKNLKSAQKPYLLERFGMMPQDALVVYRKGKALTYLGEECIWKTIAPIVKIIRFESDGLKIKFMGLVDGPVLAFDNRDVSLRLAVDDEEIDLALVPSAFEIAHSHEKSSHTWRFSTELPLRANPQKIRFKLCIGEDPVTIGRLVFSPMRCNGRKTETETKYCFSTFVLDLGKERLMKIIPTKKRDWAHALMDDYHFGRQSGSLRRKVKKTSDKLGGRQVWLYSDLPSSPMSNNSLIQLLHDLEIDDGVVRFYVTECKDELIGEYPQLDGHLLEHRSEEHLCYYLLADVILASYLDLLAFTPCKREVYNDFADLAKMKLMVYLQHGILHAHIPWYFGYERKLFDYEVVSTQFEIENLMGNYYFPKKSLIDSGAPRLDKIERVSRDSRRIVYAPSWRTYLVGGNTIDRVAINDRFIESDFFKGMHDFIKAVELTGALDRYDYQLEIKLHPHFHVYEALLPIDGNRIKLAQPTIDEGDYAIMVTDYSSYLYDFVYAGSKILYFLPDRREFEGGANHYSELDLPFEKGFGPFTDDPVEAACLLEYMIAQRESEGIRQIESEYDRRARGFFLHEDGKNADRLYAAIRNLRL